MTNNSPPVSPLYALYGGTFDPIHYGHLYSAEALAQEVNLQQIILLPNAIPPHRPQPGASAEQRLRMVELAIQSNPLFRVDDRELQRQRPSYTIDSIEALRQELGVTQPLAFIIGQDSLLSLHTWHRWQELLALCHLLVCPRPGYASTLATPALQQWLEQRRILHPARLCQQPAGGLYLAQTPLLAISATEIRQRRQQGLSCDDLLPPAVQHYIEQQGLYRHL